MRVRAAGGLRKHSRLRVPSLGSGEEGGGDGVQAPGGGGGWGAFPGSKLQTRLSPPVILSN